MFDINTSVCEQMKQRLLFILLACVAAWSFGCGRNQQDNIQAMETRTFAIEGMTCEGCVNNVTSALKAIHGVKSVDVSLKDKKATVVADSSQVPLQIIEDTVSKAGYKAHLITAAESPVSGGSRN